MLKIEEFNFRDRTCDPAVTVNRTCHAWAPYRASDAGMHFALNSYVAFNRLQNSLLWSLCFFHHNTNNESKITVFRVYFQILNFIALSEDCFITLLKIYCIKAYKTTKYPFVLKIHIYFWDALKRLKYNTIVFTFF